MSKKFWLLLFFAAPLSLWAQFSANLAVTNDYVWRGISQTDEDPALQGGFDYAFKNGFNLGAWGSNVSFSGDKDVEYDLYGSWSHELNSGLAYEIGYIYYGYQDIDYSDEAFYGMSFKGLSGKYSRGIEVEWNYLEAAYEREVLDGFTVLLHLGKFDFKEDGDYQEYKIAVTKELFGLDWELAYTDTDYDSPVSDGRFALLVSKSWTFE